LGRRDQIGCVKAIKGVLESAPKQMTPKLNPKEAARAQEKLRRELAPRVGMGEAVRGDRAIIIAAALFLAVFGAPAAYDRANLANWIPHTKVVDVEVKSSAWIVGEYKTCETWAAKPVQDVATLLCDNTSESHALEVRFWGMDDTQRNRLWNCERIEDFFTKKDSVTCSQQ
jgi:hypothetical protein